jgi:Serine dehydrogenase proteinase
VPSWGEILAELNETIPAQGGMPDLDGVRRKYLRELADLTGRPVIVYASDFLSGKSPPQATAIDLEDMQGMMEVVRDLKGPNLDLVLHSPGGSPEGAAAIVSYLRKKYSNIRVFVPLAAMSAATMWALACDRIVMGKHSQLGPIDPQMVLPTGQFPARGIIEQFETAKDEVAQNPALLGAWAPILQQLGPSLLDQCDKAEQLAQRLVKTWLAEYMFKGEDDAEQQAAHVPEFFASYTKHQSHALGIDRDAARAEGVVIDDLEDDAELQDAVLSVHHATMHTFQGAAAKIIENNLDRTYVKMGAMMPIQAVPAQIAPPQPAPQQPSGP